MTKSKYIFEQLARPGECWHELNYTCPAVSFPIKCKKCGVDAVDWAGRNLAPVVDLSTWEGFGWAWERAQEKEWWGEFCWYLFYKGKDVRPEKWVREKYGEWIYLGHFQTEYIHPTRFSDALHAFLKRGKTWE
jgi:hypothetical protein